MMPTFIVVIPARMASTRLPNKPLQNICGKSLIQRTCEQVEKAVSRDEFIVATDHQEIYDHIISLGFNSEMTSNNCLTGTDRVAEIAMRKNATHYINVQGDEPLINPNDILKVIESLKKFPKDVINGYTEITSEDDYNSSAVPKVVNRPDGRLLYMSRSAVPGNKRKKLVKSWRQVCIYAFPKELLLEFSEKNVKTPLEEIEDIEILRFLEMGHEVRMIELSSESIAVDLPEDVQKVISKLNEKK